MAVAEVKSKWLTIIEFPDKGLTIPSLVFPPSIHSVQLFECHPGKKNSINRVFQGKKISYLTYSGWWVLTYFIPLHYIYCTIILGCNAIIFTHNTDIGIWIWYLLKEGGRQIRRRNYMWCRYRDIKIYFFLRTYNWLHTYL